MNELTVLAKDINAEHDACLLSAADAVTHAIKAGEMLIKAKKQLKHGQFMAWVAQNCRFRHAQACCYMKIADANLCRGINFKDGTSIKAGLRMLTDESEEDWPESQLNRKAQVEAGETVTAHINDDQHLIAWAQENGLFLRIDRTTVWGNPFLLDEDGDRDQVCESYGRYLLDKPSLQRRYEELQGKVLGCWCYPERCHGNVLIEQLEYVHDENGRVGCHR